MFDPKISVDKELVRLSQIQTNYREQSLVRTITDQNKPVSQSCAERASRCFGGPHVP